MAKRDDLQRGLSDSLRSAVDRTFAATAGSATGTRERAQDLLDEVAKRGQEASSLVTQRVLEVIQERRLVTGEDLQRIEAKLDALTRRIGSLEGGGKSASRPAKRRAAAKPKAKATRKAAPKAKAKAAPKAKAKSAPKAKAKSAPRAKAAPRKTKRTSK